MATRQFYEAEVCKSGNFMDHNVEEFVGRSLVMFYTKCECESQGRAEFCQAETLYYRCSGTTKILGSKTSNVRLRAQVQRGRKKFQEDQKVRESEEPDVYVWKLTLILTRLQLVGIGRERSEDCGKF
jgi:hypothetical protein